jgi:hypothetical protein
MQRKKLLAISSVIFMIGMLLLMNVSTAQAITDGQLDGNSHPNVFMLIMDVGGDPMWQCSGTLIAPTVFLTAGHCTTNTEGAPFSGMRVFTQSDIWAGYFAGTNNYPYAGPNAVEASAWYTMPAPFAGAPWYMHDIGVVILSHAISLKDLGMTSWPSLPTLNSLDALATHRGQQNTYFTAVGYGAQVSRPVQSNAPQPYYGARFVAYPKLDQINAPGMTGDFSMILSNNAATGGTCFGDSGGPNFLGSTSEIAAVTSYGLNINCGGTGGVFRLDRANALSFVDSFLN